MFGSMLSRAAKTRKANALKVLIAAMLLSTSAFLFACSSDGSNPSSGSSAPAEEISVQVDVTAYEKDFFSDALALPEGATALDALEATGLDYTAEDSSYGAFVSKIDGLANGETSATAGWTYSLNGEMALESCDALVLSDGDTLTWEYAEFE